MPADERAAYDLCLYLGFPHPDHLLAHLTARQWAGWLRYLSLFPLPHDRADLNTALARWDLRAIHGNRDDLADLIPPYGRPPARRRSDEELRDLIAAHNAARTRKDA